MVFKSDFDFVFSLEENWHQLSKKERVIAGDDNICIEHFVNNKLKKDIYIYYNGKLNGDNLFDFFEGYLNFLQHQSQIIEHVAKVFDNGVNGYKILCKYADGHIELVYCVQLNKKGDLGTIIMTDKDYIQNEYFLDSILNTWEML